MASTAVYRTLAQNYGTGGGITTISFWFKRSRIDTNEVLTSSYHSGSYYGQFQLGSNNRLTIQDWRNSNVYSKTTNMEFKDTSAWYHVCWSFNNRTGGSSSSNLWINGELITSWASETEYSYQATTSWNTDYTHYIGCLNTSSSQAYFSGVIADYYFIQGQEYQASLFGETDSTTGEWKPLTNPTIDYSGTGGNSCHLKFENSANMDLDSGSNNVTFTTSGQFIQTEDCPSNNFCTLTNVYNQTNTQGVSLNNGSNVAYYASNSNRMAMGSMGMTSGKYYFEAKPYSTGSFTSIGIIDTTWDDINGASGYGLHDGTGASGFSFASDGSGKYNSNTQTSWGGSYSANDIVGVAVDCDNSKIYFAINGTWQESGDPTSGSTGTGSAFNLVSGRTYLPAVGLKNGSQVGFNFGNGLFAGSDVISSEGTNASGNGKFEYDVPTGYTALSTKGLNT